MKAHLTLPGYRVSPRFSLALILLLFAAAVSIYLNRASAAGGDNEATFTVTINQASTQSDPATSEPINFTVVFSESVADFDSSDVTLGGLAAAGATATVTGSGTTYNVAVSGMTNDGTLTATIAAGQAHDDAGNANAASTSTDNNVTYVGLDLQSSFVVNSTADTDDGACTPVLCTLRDAINSANLDAGTETVTFDIPGPGPHTIQLTGPLPDLSGSVDILNTSGKRITVRRDTGGDYRIFTIPSGPTVRISGLTITNGNSGSGGGIYNAGTLTLTNSLITGNYSGDNGGGIFNDGTLTVTNSTISGNSAVFDGTGIYHNGGSLILTSVTLAQNLGNPNINADNTLGFGLSGPGSVLLRNTVVAQNLNNHSAGTYNDGSGILISVDESNVYIAVDPASSFNLIERNNRFPDINRRLTNGTDGNQIGVTARLGPLADHGGLTQTHGLLPGSPALDQGKNFTDSGEDQRGPGFARTVDIPRGPNAEGGDGSDIGAYEVQAGPDADGDGVPDEIDGCPDTPAGTTVNSAGCPAVFVVNSTGDAGPAGSPTDGTCDTGSTVMVNGNAVPECTLRAAIQEANDTPGENTILIDIPGPGPHTIGVPSTLPALSESVDILNTSGKTVTIQPTATSQLRILVSSPGRTNLSGLILSNGGISSGRGSIENFGSLTLTNCTITGSRSFGISTRESATVNLVNSTVTGSSLAGMVADGLNGPVHLTTTNSTISGNVQNGILGQANNVFPVTITVTNSTVSGNGRGGIAIFNGTLIVTNSTISGNDTSNGSNGGGIFSGNHADTIIVTNSTISGNLSPGLGGGIFAAGQVTLTSVTITNNGVGSASNPSGSGGLYVSSTAPALLRNTIIAGNYRSTDPSTATDIAGTGTVDASSSYNLIGTGGSGGLVNGVNNNQVGIANPGLGPLANNGGLTQTHLPQIGSPALDKGDDCVFDNSCSPSLSAPLTTDQRGTGFTRKAGAHVDIGAFEANYALMATAGNNQTAATNTAFGIQLQATVTESGINRSGITVTFTAPASGASGTFQGMGTYTATVTTDSSGVVTAPVFTANGTSGSYIVTASLGTGLPEASFNLTNNAAPSITAATGISRTQSSPGSNSQIASVTDDGGNGSVAVTVSSANPSNGVTISNIANTNGAITADIVAGCSASNASFTLTASDGASTVAAILNITVAANPAPTLSYTNPSALAFNGSATVTPATAADNGLITGYGVQSVVPAMTTAPTVNSSGVVSITNAQPAGTHTITIRATDNCGATTDSSFTLTVSKGDQTITVGTQAPATAAYNSNFTVAATSNSGLAVSYSSAGACTNSGATFTMTSGTGTCTVKYDQAGDGNYNAATQVTESVSAQKANQTITFGTLATTVFGDADFDVSATTSSSLPVSFAATGQCTLAGNAVHLIGVGSCTITAKQSGDSNYNAATDVPQGFSIAGTSSTTAVTSSLSPSDFGQSVTFTATVTAHAGTPTGTVQFAADSSNIGGPQTLNGSGVATFTTSSLAVGTHIIQASYSGSANFQASSGTLAGGQVVNPQASLSINDVSVTEGDTGATNAVFTVTLSAASSLPVTVNYATANGTAIAPVDYTAIGATALSFNPGQTSKTVSVTINGDQSFEGDETFFVNLSGATNATISDNQGQGTILNDDAQGGIISFSSGNYSVAEDEHFVTITVNRTGDASAAATVDYATSDDSNPATMVSCGTVNGIASSRCDFTTAAGTLKFAAGETTKTFKVLISQDSYVETAETFPITLLNLSGGAVFGVPSITTVTITDDLPEPATNPIDDADNFVREQYHDFLNREGDAQGQAFWTGRITDCGTDAACVARQRIGVSAQFFIQQEFQQTGFYVYRAYKGALGRRPSYVEFMTDRGQLQATPNLDAEKVASSLEFVQRSEFTTKYSSATTADTFVDALIQNVQTNSGVDLTPRRNELLAAYSAGSDQTDSRARTLRMLIDHDDFKAAEYNRGFVLAQYFSYLRRNPDSTGYNFWVNVLDNNPAGFLVMVCNFITSGEYQDRFGPVRTHNNAECGQ